MLLADALLSPAGEARGRRLRLSRAAIAAGIGPRAADPDLLAHAEDRMAARLLPGLAAWAGGLPGLRLVPLPRDRLPSAAARPGAAGVLPLAAAATPEFPALRRHLADLGWGVALRGLDAAVLALVEPHRLPADLLLVRWSPALVAPGTADVLRRMDPARVVLTGGGEPAARDFAAALGFLRAVPA